MNSSQAIYLNVGCGSVKLKGFINIDRDPGADMEIDVTTGLPFPDNSIQGIYSEHFIEHLTQTDIIAFFRECRRVLKSNGTLRVATPDLNVLARHYIDNDWHQPWLEKYGYQWIRSRAEYLNISLREWGHAWVMDQEELCRLAELAGLVSPARCDIGKSADPMLQDLETRIESTLIMEFGKRTDSVSENPLVTIVIPAYKPEFFWESLNSAINQTYPNIEILVLDDSSSEKIEQITRQIAINHPRVTYLRNTPPLGEPGNLTKCIRLSSGEFIKPLYDDDILLPDAVDRLVEAFRQMPDARLAAGRRLLIDSEGNFLDDSLLGTPLASISGRQNGTQVIASIATTGVNNLGEPTIMMFRRNDALAIDEPTVMSLFGYLCFGIGDVCLASHFLSRGDLAYLAEPIAHFRIHPGQTQRQAGFGEILTATWRYFRLQVARLGMDKACVPTHYSLTHADPGPTLSIPSSSKELTPHNSKQDKNIDAAYFDWQTRQLLFPEDASVIEQTLSPPGAPPCFQIFLLLPPGMEARLADTLDSLNAQILANWHLDIVTSLPVPDGLDELPCINWHCVDTAEEEKNRIDFLATSNNYDWIIEIPAGARLDQLYLWRLTVQSKTTPEACAFFVDDDCCDEQGRHHSPRFKPGVNPEALRSSDLAGPLCVRRDIWIATGGAYMRHGSPWFSRLLCIAKRYTWDSIRHIPDVLISYPGSYPSDSKACVLALIENLHSTTPPGEIVPVTGKSWCIRYPLTSTPEVSIAVLSKGQLDLLSRCLDGIIKNTGYQNFEIIIALTDTQDDVELDSWLQSFAGKITKKFRVIRTDTAASHAARCNAAIRASDNDFVLFFREETVTLENNWLEELMRTCLQPDVAAASPCLITPGSGLIQDAGSVLGLNGIIGSPYQDEAAFGTHGYLDCLKVARDVTALPVSCMLVRKAAYLAVGGMNETELGDHLADTDLCLKLRKANYRLIYQPLANVVYGGSTILETRVDYKRNAQDRIAEADARSFFYRYWQESASIDPFWNPNLSLSKPAPTVETEFRAQWQYLPSDMPRILARPIANAQGDFRISSPLRASRKAGLVAECMWTEDDARQPTAAEITRLAPSSLIIQNFIFDHHLAALRSWEESQCSPFIVYALDDLITDMDASNPCRKKIPANSRARLKYALNRCHRLVVSTDFLAETYRHFIPDIRVVPNRLEKTTWLPLQAHKRSTRKPRIGWAGGTTHQGDLVVLKEVIEKTRNEADWVFFGMCPEEIRPLLAEYHSLVPFAEYPTHLAALNLDIAVAPLAQTAFNRGKSNLRLLEYGVLGIPVVCTDIDPYRNSPACRVQNDVTSWVEALRARIHDAEAREHEGIAMQQWVYRNYLQEDHLQQWTEAHLPD